MVTGVKYPGASPKVDMLWVDMVDGHAHEPAGLTLYGAGGVGRSCSCSVVTRLSTGISRPLVTSCTELRLVYELLLGVPVSRHRDELEAAVFPLSWAAVAVYVLQGSC